MLSKKMCSGYGCTIDNGNRQTCISVVQSYQTVSIASCVSSSPGSVTSFAIPTVASWSESSSSGIESITAFTVEAPLIDIRWRPRDLVALSTSMSAATVSSTGSTSTSTSSQTGSPTPDPGLSTAAKVAIGVVIPVVILAIIAGALLIWRRRRTRQKGEGAQVAHHYQEVKPHSPDHNPAELRGEQVYEMENSARQPELDNGKNAVQERHELAGDDPVRDLPKP
ncbi:hypothetical protein LTR86_009762 [Recurvomyces mirabilis]|nr:hypothetical protein LTR86_009762 [Recurvomyces mirabilis]